VWTVSNTSGDSWAGEFVSALNDVVVTDTDVRVSPIGEFDLEGNAIIARIPHMPDGASQQFHWCGPLIDDDSRPVVEVAP
jgi:hypothetical protein